MFEKSRVEDEKLRRGSGKRMTVALSNIKAFPMTLMCNASVKSCFSKAGVKKHNRSHKVRPIIDYQTTGGDATHHTNVASRYLEGRVTRWLCA